MKKIYSLLFVFLLALLLVSCVPEADVDNDDEEDDEQDSYVVVGEEEEEDSSDVSYDEVTTVADGNTYTNYYGWIVKEFGSYIEAESSETSSSETTSAATEFYLVKMVARQSNSDESETVFYLDDVRVFEEREEVTDTHSTLTCGDDVQPVTFTQVQTWQADYFAEYESVLDDLYIPSHGFVTHYEDNAYQLQVTVVENDQGISQVTFSEIVCDIENVQGSDGGYDPVYSYQEETTTSEPSPYQLSAQIEIGFARDAQACDVLDYFDEAYVKEDSCLYTTSEGGILQGEHFDGRYVEDSLYSDEIDYSKQDWYSVRWYLAPGTDYVAALEVLELGATEVSDLDIETGVVTLDEAFYSWLEDNTGYDLEQVLEEI